MTIKILNYRNNCELTYPLVVIFGQIMKLDSYSTVNSKILRDPVVICKFLKKNQKCSIKQTNGKFKFIYLLKTGLNQFEFIYRQESFKLNLIFKRIELKKFVKLYYVVCSVNKNDDKESMNNSIFDDGKFESDQKNDLNTINNAKKRISLASLMIQTWIASILPNRSTFDLDLDEFNYPKVEIYQSELISLNEFKLMNQEQIWRTIGVELVKLNNSNSNFKYAAFISFSRYDEKIALGGGSLACLDTCSLFSWPEEISKIEDHFNDCTEIDPKFKIIENLSHSKTYGDIYSTSLGSLLHELCHTFELGHETYGIMDREFDKISYYFTKKEHETKWFNRPSYLILSNHQFLNKKLKYLNNKNLEVESISLMRKGDLNVDQNDDLKKLKLKNEDQVFYFDQKNEILTSLNGIILIEYRDSKSYTLDFTEFNLPKKSVNFSNNYYFKMYKKDDAFNIIILDKMGHLFKFVY